VVARPGVVDAKVVVQPTNRIREVIEVCALCRFTHEFGNFGPGKVEREDYGVILVQSFCAIGTSDVLGGMKFGNGTDSEFT